MKNRIDVKEFREFVYKATGLVTAALIADKMGRSESIVSTTLSGKKRPDKAGQQNMIIGILAAIDNQWNEFDSEKKKKAEEIREQCYRYLYDDELNDPDLSIEEYEEICQEIMEDRQLHAYGVSESVEKTLQELMKLEPGKLRWLCRYYGSIHKYFVNDLLAIKQEIYPEDFIKEENSITVSEDMLVGDGFKKTLNCFFFSRYSYENSFFSSTELSEEENEKIRSYFQKEISDYILCYNNMAFDEFDSYMECILDEVKKRQDPEDFVYMEYLPYNFLSDVNLMLSITSKEWFRYGAFRLYMNKEWAKQRKEFPDLE